MKMKSDLLLHFDYNYVLIIVQEVLLYQVILYCLIQIKFTTVEKRVQPEKSEEERVGQRDRESGREKEGERNWLR